MIYSLILCCAALLSLSSAGSLPKETHCAIKGLERLAALLPLPTKGPKLELARRQLERRALTDVCGYFLDDSEASCGGGEYCAYITGYWGCCGVNTAGSFTSCAIDTTCVDYADYSVACPSGCLPQTGYCQSDHPYCAMNLLEGTFANGSPWTSTSFGCVVSPTSFILAPTPPSVTSASPSRTQQSLSASSVSISTQPTQITHSSVRVSSTNVVVISSSATVSIPSNTSGPLTSTTTDIVPAPTDGTDTNSASSTTGTGLHGNENPDSSSSHNDTGAIAGGVVGGVLGLALLIFLGWFLRKKMKNSSNAATIPEISQYSYYAE